MSSLPSGTVTFLFTDIEGSTKLAHELPNTWESLRERHHSILRGAIEANHGYVFQIIGDAFCVAFHTVVDGLSAAVEAQRGLQRDEWGEMPIKVRMGLHTGSAQFNGTDYRGYLTMAKVQRIMSVAYGGQVLLSNASAELLHTELPAGITLRDMKEHRLKGLPDPERLWQVVAPDLQQDFPPLSSLSEIPNNLPLQLTSFIGREKEVEQIKTRLKRNRLVTLTGSGGVGKTRLAIQVASELLDEYPNGVWLVELAPITDPALVPRTVCAALDVTAPYNIPALNVLTEYLKTKKILLVVDNCEHLIDSCALLGDSILRTCPQVWMIASSREALGIDGENAYRVPSLSLPDPHGGLQAIEESEAVKLFIERANAVLPAFEMTELNASFVAQICQRLDGIALAIELAVSRLKILKVEQIASRLDDAFRLLTGGSRTALPRQQTLRGTIDWSYNLLTNEERTALRRLSVFVGGWTLEAAEYVCDNPNMLDLLTHLVDKSLVAVDLEHEDEPRYYLLETIRQYAREKLAESGEGEWLRERHTRWILELAERAEPKLRGPGQLEWHERMEQEIDNLRAALEWSFHNDYDLGLRIISALIRFWAPHNHEMDCLQYVEKLFSSGLLDPTPLHAKALACASWVAMSPTNIEQMVTFAKAGAEMSREVGDQESLAISLGMLALPLSWQGEHDRALPLFEESVAICEAAGIRWVKQAVLGGVGIATQGFGDYERARAAYQESLALCRESGDIEFSLTQLSLLGGLLTEQGEFKQALNYYEESLSVARMFKNKSQQASQLRNMGETNMILGRTAQAKTLFEESITILRDLKFFNGDPAWTFHRMGRVARLQGEYEQARHHYAEGLRLAQKYNSRQSLAWCLAGLAELAALNNQPEKAVRLFGAAEAIPEFRINLWPHERLEMEQISETIRSQFDEESYAAAYQAGRQMSLDKAVAYALRDMEQ
jgi:predicted ATPase/class 3 adenylate cyclase/Tfp pilus assembly protein PilF